MVHPAPSLADKFERFNRGGRVYRSIVQNCLAVAVLLTGVDPFHQKELYETCFYLFGLVQVQHQDVEPLPILVPHAFLSELANQMAVISFYSA
jgi:hypothetical protein